MSEAFALCQRYLDSLGKWPDNLFILSNQPRLSLSARGERFPLATMSMSLDTFIANERKKIAIRIFPTCLIPHLIIGRNLSDSTETVIGHQFTFNGWLLLGNLFGEQNNHIKLLTQTFIPGWAIYCFQQVAKGAKHCLEGLDEGKFHFPLLNIRWCWQNAGNFLEGKVSWTSQVSKLFQIHDYCCYGTFHTVRGCAFSSNMSRDLTSRSLR